MSDAWLHQIRVYLPYELAEEARADPSSPRLLPLAEVLARHGARMVSQFDAFTDYVRDAEREGRLDDPLYRWTKATVDDPEKRARHIPAFALRVGGAEVYAKAAADALEADLQPLVGGGIVERTSRHDTDPAANMPVPPEYRT